METLTLIDANTAFEGKLSGKDARILGRFRGEIELTGRLVTGQGSQVKAKVTAAGAEIAGELSGEIVVRSLVLLESARVDGTIDAEALAVREGAQVNGSVSAGQPRGSRPAPAPDPRPADGVVAG